MRRRLGLGIVGWVSLACGGFSVDVEALDGVVAEVAQAEPQVAVPRLVAGGAEAGLVNPLCARCLQDVDQVDPDMQWAVQAAALERFECMCPTTCWTDGLDALVTLEEPARMERIGAACDPEGPDPVFAGPLGPLRASVGALDYLTTRLVVEGLDEAGRAAVRERLAIGMVLRANVLQATPDPVVTGGPATLLTDHTDALRACGTDVATRLVVRPDGTVAGAAGLDGCAEALLTTITLPPDGGWRVVDLTWSAASLAATPSPRAAGDDSSTPKRRPATDPPTPSAVQPTPTTAVAVRLGSVSTSGTLPPEVIRKVLQRGNFAQCPVGTATVKFSIGRDGSVASASAAAGDAALGACLARRVMSMSFPEPSGGVVVVSAPVTVGG